MACKTCRFGVFFDGTGNNQVFDICFDTTKKEKKSQQNNTYRLSELYKENM